MIGWQEQQELHPKNQLQEQNEPEWGNEELKQNREIWIPNHMVAGGILGSTP